MFFYDNYYSLSEMFRLFHSFLVTRLFYRGCLLIRRPFFVRGKPRISFGKGFTTGYNCRLEVFGERGDKTKKLLIGRNCKVGDNVHIAALERIVIGDDCLLASNIFISDLSHGSYSGPGEQDLPMSSPNDRALAARPVSIGDKVWIGQNVCVLSGVHIGNGVIIGANSVVTKSVPDFCMVAGAPARIIKRFDQASGAWVRQKTSD